MYFLGVMGRYTILTPFPCGAQENQIMVGVWRTAAICTLWETMITRDKNGTTYPVVLRAEPSSVTLMFLCNIVQFNQNLYGIMQRILPPPQKKSKSSITSVLPPPVVIVIDLLTANA